jgi:hypothetical protein
MRRTKTPFRGSAVMSGPSPPSSSESARLHAGVEADGLTVVAFDTEEQLRALLSHTGITVDAAGRLVGKEGDLLTCSSCDKTEVSIGDVGHVLPGSTYVYCKDPVCILDYLERFG